MSNSKSFAIVGAGIGGLSLAVSLQRKGYSVRVYESAPVIKPLGAGIVLAANALKALKSIGIDQQVINAGKVLKRFSIRSDKGTTLNVTEADKVFQKYGLVNTLTLHRHELHNVLLKNLAPDSLFLAKECNDFIQKENGTTLLFKDGTSLNEQYVIAADGIHSVFRRKLIPDSGTRYSGYTCWRGVVSALGLIQEDHEAIEFWGAGKRFGLVPLSDNRVYWYATVNAKVNDREIKSFTLKDIEKLFETFPSPVSAIIGKTSQDDVIQNDIIDFPPLKKFAFGSIVLTGDAAHATTPNMGQGACMAIEDALVLTNCIEKQSDIERAFLSFEHARIERTTRIVNDSFLLGRMAQLENPLMRIFRNSLLKNLPKRLAEKQLNFLLDIDFT